MSSTNIPKVRDKSPDINAMRPTVLVTRPQLQSQKLADLLQQRGFNTVIMPTVAIQRINVQAALPTALPICHAQVKPIAIFLSASAIECCPKSWSVWVKAHCQVVAIGAASAELLRLAGYGSVIVPELSSSEGLLALALLQANALTLKAIYVFCGENPRQLLFDSLRQRGARVYPLICYRRVCPVIDVPVRGRLNECDIDAMVCTSCTGLDNLYKLLAIAHNEWWLKKTVFVIGQRIAQHAQQLGFNTVVEVTQASNQAIVECVCNWYG